METQIIKDIEQMKKDLRIIKEILLSKKDVDNEGKLTDWAKKELAKARAEPEENYISLENLRKEIENDL